VSTSDHHSAYLAKAIAALTPEGHRRVDELLEQLGEAAGNHEAVALFATARKAEADLGPTGVAEQAARRTLSAESWTSCSPGSGRFAINRPSTTSPTGRTPSWRCWKMKPTTRADLGRRGLRR
jgi:hypothetical protein